MLTKKLDLIIKYSVATVLVAIALYPKFPLFKVPGTFVSIRLEDFLLLFCALIVLIKINADRNILRKDNLFRAVILYCLVGLLSLMSAQFVTKTISLNIGLLHFLRRIEYFIPLFLGYYYIKKNSLEFFIKVNIFTLFFVILYGFGQRFLNWPVIITQNMEYSKGVALRWIPGSHINSTFAGHYDLATYLVLILPMLVVLLVLFRNKLYKLMLLIPVFGALWLLVNTASRISLVSYLGSVTIALLLAKKYKVIPLVIVVSILFMGFSGNLVSRYKRFYDVVIEKMRTVNLINNSISVYAASINDDTILNSRVTTTPTPMPVFEDRSTNIRLNVEWPRAIRALSKNPLLGTGYSSITLATDNDYLRALGETGLLGFLSFMLIIFIIMKKILQASSLLNKMNYFDISFIVGLSGSFFGILLNAVFIDIFEASKFAIYLWLFTGVYWGLISKYE